MVPPELSGVLELFTPQAADSGRQKRLQFLVDRADPPQSDLGASRQNPARSKIVQYFTEAAPQFQAWSPGNHLHFGYASRIGQIFDRESMLAEMTRQVLCRLQLDPTEPASLLDLGCGLGASALQVARQHPRFAIDGISLVPAQVAQAADHAAASGMARRLRFWVDDFTACRSESGSYDGLYAIESACHDHGLAKEGFVKEAARLLKGGRRLVVADAFYKGHKPKGGLLEALCSRVEDHRALETFGEIGAFTSALRRHGFTEIRVEEISTRVAASVAHAPVLAARAFLEGLLGQRPLGKAATGHLLASLLAPLLGLARTRFGYFLVSARRRRV